MDLNKRLWASTFHDAVLADIRQTSFGVQIVVDDFYIEEMGYYTCKLDFEEVSHLSLNGSAVDVLSLEGENDGILEITHENGVARVAVMSGGPRPEDDQFSLYEFRFGGLTIEACKVDDESAGAI